MIKRRVMDIFNYIREAFSNLNNENILRRISMESVVWSYGTVVSLVILTILSPKFIDNTEYAAILTSIEAALGVISIWLTIKVFKIGSSISGQQVEFLQRQNQLIEQVHKALIVSMRTQHFQRLRSEYFDAKDSDDKELLAYWHFYWRFETYSGFTIHFKNNGFARIRVEGVNNSALETNYEKLDIPIYSVDVFEVKGTEELKTGAAYCWCISGKPMISNDANERELQNPAIEFEIGGLGHPQARAVGPKPKCYLRLKDLTDISKANLEQ